MEHQFKYHYLKFTIIFIAWAEFYLHISIRKKSVSKLTAKQICMFWGCLTTHDKIALWAVADLETTISLQTN